MRLINLSRRRSLAAMLLLALPLAAGHSMAEPKPDFSKDAVEAIKVEARRIDHFSKADPQRRQFGKLEFRGGLVLTSPSSKFGGWSAIEIDPDGRRILAISDVGLWMTATLAYNGKAPAAVNDARIGPIVGIGGTSLDRPRDRDAEGVVQLDGTLAHGTVLISFEQNHRIGRFPISDKGLGAPTGYLPLPPEVRRQSPNKSLESVCIMRGGPHKGAVVTLSERFPDRTETRHTGWMSHGSMPASAASWSTLSISNIGGFDLTDCRGLPDGSLLVLERRFRWSSWYEGVKTRLRRFSASEMRGGGTMQGEILLEADLDYEIDNLEGLATHRTAAGETILTLISDDNFNHFLQRTVLLQFALPAAERPAQVQASTRP